MLSRPELVFALAELSVLGVLHCEDCKAPLDARGDLPEELTPVFDYDECTAKDEIIVRCLRCGGSRGVHPPVG